jgi:stress-induced morphogen
MSEFPKQKLVEAFRSRFGGDVESDSDADGGADRFKFYLVSPAFVGVSNLKRQDEAWAVVDSVLSREEALQVTAILPLTPDEVRELAG